MAEFASKKSLESLAKAVKNALANVNKEQVVTVNSGQDTIHSTKGMSVDKFQSVSHNGGEFISVRKTNGNPSEDPLGYRVIKNGLASIECVQKDARTITVELVLSDGEKQSIDIENTTPSFRGIYSKKEEYKTSEMVIKDGCLVIKDPDGKWRKAISLDYDKMKGEPGKKGDSVKGDAAPHVVEMYVNEQGIHAKYSDGTDMVVKGSHEIVMAELDSVLDESIRGAKNEAAKEIINKVREDVQSSAKELVAAEIKKAALYSGNTPTIKSMAVTEKGVTAKLTDGAEIHLKGYAPIVNAEINDSIERAINAIKQDAALNLYEGIEEKVKEFSTETAKTTATSVVADALKKLHPESIKTLEKVIDLDISSKLPTLVDEAVESIDKTIKQLCKEGVLESAEEIDKTIRDELDDKATEIINAKLMKLSNSIITQVTKNSETLIKSSITKSVNDAFDLAKTELKQLCSDVIEKESLKFGEVIEKQVDTKSNEIVDLKLGKMNNKIVKHVTENSQALIKSEISEQVGSSFELAEKRLKQTNDETIKQSIEQAEIGLTDKIEVAAKGAAKKEVNDTRSQLEEKVRKDSEEIIESQFGVKFADFHEHYDKSLSAMFSKKSGEFEELFSKYKKDSQIDVGIKKTEIAEYVHKSLKSDMEGMSQTMAANAIMEIHTKNFDYAEELKKQYARENKKVKDSIKTELTTDFKSINLDLLNEVKASLVEESEKVLKLKAESVSERLSKVLSNKADELKVNNDEVAVAAAKVALKAYMDKAHGGLTYEAWLESLEDEIEEAYEFRARNVWKKDLNVVSQAFEQEIKSIREEAVKQAESIVKQAEEAAKQYLQDSIYEIDLATKKQIEALAIDSVKIDEVVESENELQQRVMKLEDALHALLKDKGE